MEPSSVEVNVIILARDREVSIGSTIYKIQNEIDSVSVSIVVFDNGSQDDTSVIASMAGARVVRYKHHHERSMIFKRAVEEASKIRSRITVLLDTLGENTAEDAVSLANVALKKGKKFAYGYVEPDKGEDTIGCLALDRNNVMKLKEKEEDIEMILLEIAHSQDLRKTRFTESIEMVTKRKLEEKKEKVGFVETFRMIRRQHPLKFYGVLGVISLVGALISGFYTVDYFYRNQHLSYLPAFLTVLLVMISGFLMVAGLMLNALNLMVERIKALKKWEKATNGK